MSVVAQPDFEQSAGNTVADIITPAGTPSTIFIGLDTFFRCKDSGGNVLDLITEDDLRIKCGVYSPR